MKDIVNVFCRHEKKYLITDEQKKQVLQGLEGRMIPDPHGLSTICNIYYDTPDHRLIRRSLEKPVYKEKIRLRSYGTPGKDSVVFLELKKKYKGIVYKRRIELKEADAERYMAGGMDVPELMKAITNESSPQIVKEIDYFRNYYRNLRPAVYLSYDRCAYFSREDESLRITFDKNIQWRDSFLKLTDGPGGRQLLRPDQSIMEIKTAYALPLWLTDILSEAEIRPTSFSKYGRAYQEILKEELNERREGTENNDEYIFKHIYSGHSYSRGLHNKSGGSSGIGGADRFGILLPRLTLERIPDYSGAAACDSSCDNYDGEREHWSISSGGRSLFTGEIPLGTRDR